VQALIYFDAPDPTTSNQYQLDAAGLSSFAGLSQSAYFEPTQAATTVTVASSASSLKVGQAVTLTAAVQASDLGGNVAFLDNGSVFTGCAAIPALGTISCPGVVVDGWRSLHHGAVQRGCRIRVFDLNRGDRHGSGCQHGKEWFGQHLTQWHR
jgi:hypothetical protein